MGTAIVGLTGGIGCGKSTVATLFADRGVTVVDTDVLAHRLTVAGGKAIPALVAAFGHEAFSQDGALDRRAMREKVFESPAIRAQLEGILHPLIREEVDVSLPAACHSAPYAILVVPLMYESMAYRSRVSRVLAIDCPQKSQIERVSRRPGLDESTARKILASQLARPYRLQLANDLIFNDGAQMALVPQVANLHRRYCEMFSEASPTSC